MKKTKKRNYKAEIAANEARIQTIDERCRRYEAIWQARHILRRMNDEGLDLERENDCLRQMTWTARQRAIWAAGEQSRILASLGVD